MKKNKSKKIQVNEKQFRRFLRERAAMNGLKTRTEKRREEMNLPQACKTNMGEWVIEDEKGNPIGKYTVSSRKEFFVSSGYKGQIS